MTELVELRDERGRLLLESDGRKAILYLAGATVTIEDGAVKLRGRTVEIEGRESIRLSSPKLEAEFDVVRARASDVEGVFGRIVTWSKSLYQRIEGIFSSRAGRVRAESAGSMLLQAQSTRVQADEDVKVVGRAIHLG